jgi:hypothetical protein
MAEICFSSPQPRAPAAQMAHPRAGARAIYSDGPPGLPRQGEAVQIDRCRSPSGQASGAQLASPERREMAKFAFSFAHARPGAAWPHPRLPPGFYLTALRACPGREGSDRRGATARRGNRKIAGGARRKPPVRYGMRKSPEGAKQVSPCMTERAISSPGWISDPP